MSSEQAIIVQEGASDLFPFDPAILTGQLRPSSIAMYCRDLSTRDSGHLLIRRN